jgi:hypothetical protein
MYQTEKRNNRSSRHFSQTPHGVRAKQGDGDCGGDGDGDLEAVPLDSGLSRAPFGSVLCSGCGQSVDGENPST